MIPVMLAGIFNEWAWILILGFLALMVFGRRLPEMGKSLGKGIVEFKKGLAGSDDDAAKTALPTGDSAPKAALTSGAPAATSGGPKSPDDELRETREQLRQLREELRATKEQITQAITKPPR